MKLVKKSRTNLSARLIVGAFTLSFAACCLPLHAANQEVVFRVGASSTIDWFVINNPIVHGTLKVTNASALYGNNAGLNAAAVDESRHRLVFDKDVTNAHGYAIDLQNLQLTPNAATSVTATDLGEWPGGGANAGYRKSDQQILFHPDNSSELEQLNFDANGKILPTTTSKGDFTNVNGKINIHAGDIDFQSDGSIWVSGDVGNASKLWKFDPTTLTALKTFNQGSHFNGITFDADGKTLYGYRSATDNYGTIDLDTGNLTVLDHDPNFFGASGDLATATEVDVLNGIPGDYNGNGKVDAADYVMWRNGTNPLTNEVATLGQNTPEDYAAWRARYGNTTGSGTTLNASAVPEPALSLPALVILLTSSRVRRRATN